MTRTKQTGPPMPATPATLPVTEYKGQLVADSRDVAAMMGRNHQHFIRSIRTYCGYLNRSNFGSVTQRNFALSEFFIPSTYQDKKGEERPCYLLTEMGCEFVANKATGGKGAIFTAQYVKAFHTMRDELARRRELRAIGKPIQRGMTDALRDSGEVERMKGYAYSTYTDLALKLATGKTARQLRRERGAAKGKKAVDILMAAELEVFQRKESDIAALLAEGLDYDTIKATLAGKEAP